MRENKVEKHLRLQVKVVGGLCEKHTSPGRAGAPDDLITWPDGLMELVETKAPGKGPEDHQARDHARRARRRVQVTVADTIEKVDAYIASRREHYVGIRLLGQPVAGDEIA